MTPYSHWTQILRAIKSCRACTCPPSTWVIGSSTLSRSEASLRSLWWLGEGSCVRRAGAHRPGDGLLGWGVGGGQVRSPQVQNRGLKMTQSPSQERAWILRLDDFLTVTDSLSSLGALVEILFQLGCWHKRCPLETHRVSSLSFPLYSRRDRQAASLSRVLPCSEHRRTVSASALLPALAVENAPLAPSVNLLWPWWPVWPSS